MKIKVFGVKQNLSFIIYKLFTSKNYNLFKIIIGLLFLLLIIILYPIIKIKIIEIETRAIGHFSISLEIFLAEIKNGIINKKRTIFLCFTNKRIANNFLLNKWKNYLFIKNFFFLEIAFMFLTKYYFLGKFFLPYRHWRNHKTWQIRDTHNLLPKTSPFIIFNNKEKKSGEKLLKKIGIRNSEEYFCFFARDHSYRNQFETDGKDSVRNSNVNDQLKGIQLIINKNLKAVRVGSVVNEKLSIKNSNIIDYPSSGFRSDFLDVFLIFHCNFMISTGSGIENLATLNRKKVLQVNYIGLENLHNLPNDIYFPIILPKKYINLKTKKLLTFKEIFQSRLHSESFLKKDLVSIGFALIDNTENEIKDAILEMDKFIKSKKETAFEKDNANNEFWEIYKFYHNGYCPQNIKISEKFLHKNKKLLS
jgi:putative glycosyltransferase (TIGR04372 family)